MGIFRKKNKNISPIDLDWGEITPDAYNQDENNAFYVFGFHMIQEESRKMASKYITGKVLWYKYHLPENCSHSIKLDIRGQREIKFEMHMMSTWRKNTIELITNNEVEIVTMDILA